MNITIWGVLAIIAAIGLVIFYRKKVAWGMLLLGIVTGFSIAVVRLGETNSFQPEYIKKPAIIGALGGVAIALFNRIRNQSKEAHKPH